MLSAAESASTYTRSSFLQERKSPFFSVQWIYDEEEEPVSKDDVAFRVARLADLKGKMLIYDHVHIRLDFLLLLLQGT